MDVLALFGPTGVGKTAVAVALAERLRARGEDPVAVSADAPASDPPLSLVVSRSGASPQAAVSATAASRAARPVRGRRREVCTVLLVLGIRSAEGTAAR